MLINYISKYIKYLTIVLCIVQYISVSAHGGNIIARNYVDQFKDIAIMEMYRTGIPASIKLAQAMLESNFGRSVLAVEGNNHFGIKCKQTWSGGTIYYNDDAPNECFRKYQHVLASYKDHSNFLVDRKDRYQFLFDLNPIDYVAWASGLQKAGYATNPTYANKLINMIERYELYTYDSFVAAQPIVFAENICINKSGQWTISKSEPAVTDVTALLKVIPEATKNNYKQQANNNLAEASAMLEASIDKRPLNEPRKCLSGEPVVAIDVDKIRPDISKKAVSLNTPSTEASVIAGVELNPDYTPPAHIMEPHIITAGAYHNNKPTTTATNITAAPAKRASIPLNTDSIFYLLNNAPEHVKVNTSHYKKITIDTIAGLKQPNKAQVKTSNGSTAVNTVNTKSKVATDQSTNLKTSPPSRTVANTQISKYDTLQLLPKLQLHKVNDTYAVMYRYKVSAKQIADTYKLSVNEVVVFNDLSHSDVPFPSLSNIYLAKKPMVTSKRIKTHTAKDKETLWEVAQNYGVQLSQLIQLNQLDKNAILEENQVIKLRK